MKLTRAADYAVRAMIQLARHAPGTRAGLAELALISECPDHLLSKVLQNLTRAGLIISHRGKIGGFELAPAHRAATVLEIIEAVEGPIHLNICVDCELRERCASHSVWQEAHDALACVLRSATIEDLARIQTENEIILLETRPSMVELRKP